MQKKENKIFNICLVLLYSISIILISCIHEFTVDELQSWLIARDLNWLDVIKQMKYEGHSFFWHFIIYPLAHNGFSVYYQKIIPIISCIITSIIIVKKAPFDKLLKILIIFSPAMLFYSSQFARPYCLIPLFLVCILVMYEKKEKHPYIYAVLLGLLANTHLVICPVVGMLALYFWGDKLFLHFKELTKKEKIHYICSALILCLFVFIVAVVTILGFFNCNIVKEYEGVLDFIKNAIISILTTVYRTWQIFMAKYEFSIIMAALPCIALLGIFDVAKYDIKNGLVFILQFIFMFIVHTVFWFPIPSRMFLIIYEIMFWLWIYKKENPDGGKIPKFKKYNLLEWMFILFLISLIPGNISLISADINRDFTLGQEASKFIEENIPENSVIIQMVTDYQQFLAAFLDKDKYKIYNPLEKDYRTFSIWNDNYKLDIYDDDIVEAYNTLKEKYDNIYVFYITYPNDVTKEEYEKRLVESMQNLNLLFNAKSLNLKNVYYSDYDKIMQEYFIYDAVSFYIFELNEV